MIDSEELKILYITSIDLSLERGPGINEREFVLSLDRAKQINAHYLLPRPAQQLKELSKLSGKVTFFVRNNFYNPFIFLLHTFTMFYAYLKMRRLYEYDLIVFRFDIFPLGPFLVVSSNRIPYAIKTLEYFDYFKYQQGIKGFIGKIVYPFSSCIHRRLVAGAVAVDVCTKSFIKFFSQRLDLEDNTFTYIDNAVNTERFSPLAVDYARERIGLDRFSSIVGFIGGRPEERGGMQIIKAAPYLLKKHCDIGFVIAGGNKTEVNRLINAARDCGVENSCVFPGHVVYEDVVLYINSFDVCVAFDLSSRTDIFGNASQKIRQYIACGKPVVIGEEGNEFVQEEGLGSAVKVNDLQSIIKAIDKWLSLTEIGKELHANKASIYAQRNLSYDKTIEMRLKLWKNKLGMNISNID